MPSLIRLSPSSTVASRDGAPLVRMTAVAATGPVGASTAPSTNAAAHGIPATTWTAAATAPIVASTRPKASSAIGWRFVRTSSNANVNADG